MSGGPPTASPSPRKACLPPSLLHGLVATGFPETGAKQVLTLMVQQIRQVAKSHSMWTHETNHSIMHRLGISHPAALLDRALQNLERADCFLGVALRPSEAQLQWRHMLRAQIGHALRLGHSAASARLVPVDRIIHETFTCKDCGVSFSTAAALKRHVLLQQYEGGAADRQTSGYQRDVLELEHGACI